jgi:uncharacterized protein GlcG (DUF336 family)
MERQVTISAMMPPGHEDVVGSFVTMKEEVMRRIVVVLSLVAFVGVTGFSPVGIGTAAQEATPTAAAEELTEEEIQGIIDAAVAAAEQTPSLLRVDAQGAPLTTRMHIAIVDRNGALLALHSMEDAWTISIDIAQAKAYTAGGLSSDENALSSRSVGVLTQPGGALWNIGNSNDPGTGDDTVEERGLIEFPGGLPLYKNGVLVGGIGVSGDGVDQDEAVAEAGAAGYEPSPVIRVDCVLGLPGVYSTFAAPCPGA